MPDGSQRVKRLACLAEMRNRALRPLDTFDPDLELVPSDKILFLNGIAFRPIDAAQLLFSTNTGNDGKTKYLSTCALDWRNPYLIYDLFAQRDAEAFTIGVPFYPFFTNAGLGHSRRDVLAQKDAVRVSSCWAGIVAMKANFVQNMNETLPSPDFQDIGRHMIEPDNPNNVTVPVRFRYEPEIFFDSCEFCLFLADIAQAARRAGTVETGIYVNPYVRVAYDWDVLAWVRIMQHQEHLYGFQQAIINYFVDLPKYNPYRSVGEGDRFLEEVWRDGQWKLVQRTGRNGLFCGDPKMYLMRSSERPAPDAYWDVVERVPPGYSHRG